MEKPGAEDLNRDHAKIIQDSAIGPMQQIFMKITTPANRARITYVKIP